MSSLARTILIALFWLPLSTGWAGDQAPLLQAAAEIRDRALQTNRAYETLSSLTHEVGPRMAGSEGDRAAVAWALSHLQALGFDRVVAEDVSVPRWERGIAVAEILAPFPQTLATVALGGSIGTPDTGIEAPVIRVEGLPELKALTAAEVSGKIVYIARRTERSRDASGYAKSVINRYNGPVAAAELGAVAFVIRSVGTSNARLAHTGATRYVVGKPRIPAVAISNPDADLLDYQMTTGKTVRLRLKVTARSLPATRSANIIADMQGTQPDAGIVLLGAHLDSWDLGTGAIDDGAGIAIVTEAARQVRLAGPHRRTIRVVLYANEERGLSGANAYARAHQAELANHVAAMEADMGAGRAWRLSARVGDPHWPRVQTWMPLFEPLGVEPGTNTARGGADIAVLGRNGVPLMSFNQDASTYFDYHHTASDTLDKVNPADLSQVVAAYSALAYLLANDSQAFGRLAPPAPPPP
jgi:carboxypeptidase Q